MVRIRFENIQYIQKKSEIHVEINYIKIDDVKLEELQALTNPVAESCSKS